MERSLKCETFYQVKGDLIVEIKLSAIVHKDTDDSVALSHRTLELQFGEEDYSWYEYQGSSQSSLKNDKNYRPRKYKDHLKFEYDFEMNGIEDDRPTTWGIFGSFELIIPKTALTKNEAYEFKSVVIMTAISDHWGGSRTLKCSIR